MRIHFVLVEPATPENVGAAARALKTMGFDSLRIVDSDAHLMPPARWMAHASEDILDAAVHFPTLAQALADVDFAIATTSRPRMARRDHYTPPQARELLRTKVGAVANAAIVFGPEKRGLKNADVAHCDVTSYVPMRQRQPSLNLAQSVMVYAYELSPLAFEAPAQELPRDDAQWRALREGVSHVLERMKLPRDDSFHVRVLERLSALGTDDIRMVHSLRRRVARHIAGGA